MSVGEVTSGVDRLLADARRTLPPRPGPGDLPALRARGALIVDIRPVEQRSRDGEIDGALVIDRNVLEWRLDPSCPQRTPEATCFDREIVVICDEGYSARASSRHATAVRPAAEVIRGDDDKAFKPAR